MSDWHLVCVTRLGRVSILKNLDLRTARETYKKLRPEEYPEKVILSEDDENNELHHFGWGRTYGKDDDFLNEVHPIGPEGMELDPWHGVTPRVIDYRTEDEKIKAAAEDGYTPTTIG